MASKGKNKGTAFEREVCKQLSLWWSEKQREDIFWRSSTSGGRATIRSKQGKETINSAGDVSAICPSGIPFLNVFAVEIKRGYSKFTPFDLIDKNPIKAGKNLWQKWVLQAFQSKVESNSMSWLIIFKRDGKRTMVMMPNDIVSKKLAFSNASLFVIPVGDQTCSKVKIRGPEFWVLALDEFLNHINRISIRRLGEPL